MVYILLDLFASILSYIRQNDDTPEVVHTKKCRDLPISLHHETLGGERPHDASECLKKIRLPEAAITFLVWKIGINKGPLVLWCISL